ncbi:acetyl-CoA carboxylase biotin carboxylase subunit [Saccharopolyspora erythraea]|nr:acetyl-CoA carboxylase biotin carboxylase subunit [Saccharopolyspora erythraea]
MELLELDLELEADLGIDSVKQVEVLTAVRGHFGISGDVEVDLSEVNTLRKVIDFIVVADLPEPGETPSAVSVTPARPAYTPVLERELETVTHRYLPVAVERPLSASADFSLSGKGVVVIADRNGQVCGELLPRLTDAGAGVRVVSPAGAGIDGAAEVDLSDPQRLEDALAAARDELEQVQVVINLYQLAGASEGESTLDAPVERWTSEVDTRMAVELLTEVQVVCDDYGAAVHLGERDCSVQRRHQKLIEEAPSPYVDSALREALGEASLRGAKAVGYRGAGTMEFLVDDAGEFWFMEMNARIQVEHPVTELVTGVDLIAEQIRVAAGERLSVEQADVEIRGHAIECRINAEDPDRGFVPTPGRLDAYVPPDGPWTRVDSHCVPGATVSPYYDSMIAKLITWAPHREAALDRMQRALGEFRVEGKGVRTTIPFHEEVLAHPSFRAGEVTTSFLKQHLGM